MNLYHWRYFVDAVREGSVSRSAAINRVNHSTVSQAIRSLEELFGVELLVHSKRRFELTPAGELAYTELKTLLANFEESRQHIEESEQVARGELILWAPQSLYVKNLYHALRTYRDKYPGVHLKLYTGAAAPVRRAIREGDAHVGLLVDDGQVVTNFESQTVREGEFLLIGNKKGEKIGDRQLIITNKLKQEVAFFLKRLPSAQHELGEKGMEVVSWSVIKSLVSHGLGHGYMPDYVAEDEIKAKNLFSLKIPGRPYRYKVKAIWQKGRILHPNARRLLDLL